MSSRKQGSHTHGQQSAAEDNFKKPARSNRQRSKVRRASSGKKTAGPQQKNLEPALPGRWGGRSAENPPSGSVRKTRKNKQETPGKGDGGGAAPQPPRKKRARAGPTVESEEAFKSRMEVKVKIPEELKPWLLEDGDFVTRQKQLFQLPAKKNVDAILEEHANCKKSWGNVDSQEYAVNEVVAGIKEYFNVMLGTQLLYKFERPQDAETLLVHPDTPMSQVHGAPHPLRLFVRIGAMLAYMPLDEKSLALLLGYLHDFLKYLAKNAASLFPASDYKVAWAEYPRKAL
ncbi:LOW QUALITY PROTEIN: mortality factor 4-like protein 2 [Mustela erminea]|uniref:LOW QUALITY PROTEIN: mortality factor 4-like protein 2 n=1 Tax=Mustela erminea TaxID=36723 RepID=UPI00138688B5|nr:LOW QUALITY PROTEIN: mortality factor 4-like protein 2 [Mustela erminea]